MKGVTWIAAFFAVLPSVADAQIWQCTSPPTNVACAPGSPNCSCQEVREAPAPPPVVYQQPAPPVVVQQPTCPVGSYWNGAACVMISVPIPGQYPYGANPWLWHQWHQQHPN